MLAATASTAWSLRRGLRSYGTGRSIGQSSMVRSVVMGAVGSVGVGLVMGAVLAHGVRWWWGAQDWRSLIIIKTNTPFNLVTTRTPPYRPATRG